MRVKALEETNEPSVSTAFDTTISNSGIVGKRMSKSLSIENALIIKKPIFTINIEVKEINFNLSKETLDIFACLISLGSNEDDTIKKITFNRKSLLKKSILAGEIFIYNSIYKHIASDHIKEFALTC